MAKIGLVSKNADRQKVPQKYRMGHFLGHLLEWFIYRCPNLL